MDSPPYFWAHPGRYIKVYACSKLGVCRLKTDLELSEDSHLQLELKLSEDESKVRVEPTVVGAVQSPFSSLSFARLIGDERTQLRKFLLKLIASKT